MDIKIVLLYLFGHKNTRRIRLVKKTKGQLSGKKDQMDRLYLPADWLNLPADWLNPRADKASRQRIKPVHLVLIFFIYFLREYYDPNQRKQIIFSEIIC